MSKWINTRVVIDIETNTIVEKEGFFYSGPLALLVDNVTLNSGTGGATAAADDIGGVHHQRVKLSVGADGSASDAIPVSDGLDTTAAGVQAVGIVGQLDDTATGAVTENQFAPVRISTRRALLVEGVASGTAVPVSAASLPLPSGASTSAKQDTVIGHLDGVEGLLTTIDSDTGTLAVVGGGVEATALRVTVASDSTGVLSVDDNGGSLTVDGTVTANLAAGTNNIGDVDVLSVVPGTGATNLGKAIDTATGATDTGVLVLVTRDDALGALTPIEGDNVALRVDANGALWTHDDVLEAAISGSELQVDVVASLPAGTNAIGKLAANTGVDIGDVDVTSIIPGTGATNLGKAIDTATGGTDTGVLALATRDDALGALTPIEGDNVQLRTDANGALWTHDDALDAALSGSELQVDVVASLPAGTNNIGDVDVLTIAAGDNNIGNVDIVTMPNVTLAAGTNTNEVVGDVAHDAAAAGNPVIVAGVAQNTDDTAPPNRVSAESDATRIATDLDGAVFVRPYGPQVWSYHSDGSTALTDATVHAAPGAGLSLYVTDIIVSTGAATAMNVFFEEATTKVLGPYYLEAVAGRGLIIKFQTPKKITANTALTVTTSAAIAQCVDVTGFTAQG